MEKAKIIVEQENNGEKSINVMFNPAEYNIVRTANYSEKAVIGNNGKLIQYLSGENETITMTLYFDTYIPEDIDKDKPEGGENVLNKTKEITDLTNIIGDLHRPPIVKFEWGNIKFNAIVTNVNSTITMFLSNGTPVRAKLDVTFKVYHDLKKDKQEQPFASPDRTKFRTIHQGEQLWNFAYNEYKDPDMWRVIADENNIDNPLEIYSGQVIKIPSL